MGGGAIVDSGGDGSEGSQIQWLLSHLSPMWYHCSNLAWETDEQVSRGKSMRYLRYYHKYRTVLAVDRGKLRYFTVLAVDCGTSR